MKKLIIIASIVIVLLIIGSWIFIPDTFFNVKKTPNGSQNSCDIDQDCITKAENGVLEDLPNDQGKWNCVESKCTWNTTINEGVTGNIVEEKPEPMTIEVGVGDKIKLGN